MAALTKTDVVNMSFSILGAGHTVKRITDITNTTNPDAVDANFWFSATAQEILADPDVNWSFAKKRKKLTTATLTAGNESLDFGSWLYAYALPTDWLKFVKIMDEEHDMDEQREGWTTQYKFTREGQYLLSNQNGLYLSYIYDNQDTATWPIQFAWAFACMLASHLADSITKNPQLADQLLTRYEKYYKPRAIRENNTTEYTENEEGNNDCLEAGRI